MGLGGGGVMELASTSPPLYCPHTKYFSVEYQNEHLLILISLGPTLRLEGILRINNIDKIIHFIKKLKCQDFNSEPETCFFFS